jgi:hypothetical protein
MFTRNWFVSWRYVLRCTFRAHLKLAVCAPATWRARAHARNAPVLAYPINICLERRRVVKDLFEPHAHEAVRELEAGAALADAGCLRVTGQHRALDGERVVRRHPAHVEYLFFLPRRLPVRACARVGVCSGVSQNMPASKNAHRGRPRR